jgi:hypothetical protein
VFIYAQFQPKPSSNEPQVSQVQMQDCQVVVKKVTKPDGSVDEVTQFLSSQRQKQEVKPQAKPKLYSVGLKREYDFKHQNEAYELSLGRQINETFSVVVSYSTQQVAGVGVVVRF